MTSPSLDSGLFGQLRGGTLEQHRVLEEQINPFLRFENRDAYRKYLESALTFYQGVEKDLGEKDWTAVGLDFEARRKVPLLEADLVFLKASGLPAFPPPPQLAIENLPHAMGHLYVLEGATLGSQVISRHLQIMGIGPHNGGSFFAGYGARTGEMWKAFQAAANRCCPEEAQIRDAVRGAREMFERFSSWMLPRLDANEWKK